MKDKERMTAPNRTKTLPALRVGIGGPVGSGKTTLLEVLCKKMAARYDLVAITNDIYTKEDQLIRTRAQALNPFSAWRRGPKRGFILSLSSRYASRHLRSLPAARPAASSTPDSLPQPYERLS